MPASDREKSLDSRRVSDLLDILDKPPGSIAKDHALNALLHKRIADKPKILERTLATSKDENLRIVALRGMGMSVSELSRDVLIQRLPSLSLSETRVALSSIAKIGDKSALDALATFRVTAPASLHARIDAARRLIAFRHGIDAMPLTRPPIVDIRRPGAGEGIKMPTKVLGTELLREFSRRITEEVPGLELSLESALEAICLKQRIWLMHSRKLDSAGGIKNLLERPQVPLVIMGYSYCSDRPYLYAHVMSQPADDGVDLFVTRLNGVVTHYGIARLSGEAMSFEMSAVKTRFAPAVHISGKFASAGDGLHFQEAVTSEDTSEQAKLARRPHRVDALEVEPLRPD